MSVTLVRVWTVLVKWFNEIKNRELCDYFTAVSLEG